MRWRWRKAICARWTTREITVQAATNRFLAKAFESYLYYLGPTPKIVFFPVMIMWFGVGPESKIAMGTLSCFFPIVLSAAAGMRQGLEEWQARSQRVVGNQRRRRRDAVPR